MPLRRAAAEEGTAPPAAAAAARRAQAPHHARTIYHFRDNTRRRRPRRTPVTQRVSDVRLPGLVLTFIYTIIKFTIYFYTFLYLANNRRLTIGKPYFFFLYPVEIGIIHNILAKRGTPFTVTKTLYFSF